MFYTNNELLYHEDQSIDELMDAKEKLEKYLEIEKGKGIELEIVEDPGYPVIPIPEGVTYLDLDECFRPHLALKSFNGEMLKLNQTKIIDVRHEFTSDERTELQSNMVESMIELKQVEAEKKQIMAQYKARIEKLEKLAFENAELLARGYEYRETECNIILNFEEGKKYYQNVNEPETSCKIEDIEKFDSQLQLFVDPNPESKLQLHLDKKAEEPAEEPEPEEPQEEPSEETESKKEDIKFPVAGSDSSSDDDSAPFDDDGEEQGF